MTISADGDDYTWNSCSGETVLNPDLRTADQRERDDVAALAMRIDNLVDVVEALAQRLGKLEQAMELTDTLVLTSAERDQVVERITERRFVLLESIVGLLNERQGVLSQMMEVKQP